MDLDEFAAADDVVIGRNRGSWWESIPGNVREQIINGVRKGHGNGVILRWLEQEYPELEATKDKLSRGIKKGLSTNGS